MLLWILRLLLLLIYILQEYCYNYNPTIAASYLLLPYYTLQEISDATITIITAAIVTTLIPRAGLSAPVPPSIMRTQNQKRKKKKKSYHR